MNIKTITSEYLKTGDFAKYIHDMSCIIVKDNMGAKRKIPKKKREAYDLTVRAFENLWIDNINKANYTRV